MSDRGVRVPRHRGEATRRWLVGEGFLRTDLAIRADGDSLVFPVTAEAVVPAERGEEVVAEFDAREAPAASDYRDGVAAELAPREALPRSFDVVGDVVLVRIPPALAAAAPAIGAALLGFVPGARIVGWDRGVHGPDRRRTIERIAGSGGWATVHHENHLAIDVDLERAYFSPRLAREHARVAAEVAAGDRVYDLCCGVGPFSLQIARAGRARSIVAVDANPDAIALLERSRARIDGGARIEAVRARIESFVPDREPVERVILNLPHEGIKYAPSVAPAVAPGGRFYHYEIVPRAELTGRAEALVLAVTAATGPFRLVDVHPVHPYSPDADLFGFVLERGAA
ncbi:MAG TPA: methyltransferase domain-containing protein [Thermoplasmata archaeon]|nr:methyltransferase domain-containing protein [Thermoplasmata archaeon]